MTHPRKPALRAPPPTRTAVSSSHETSNGQPLTAEAYLAAIVESSDDAILSKNIDGIIQSCNAAVERIFGYRPEELIGRPVSILIPLDRRAEEDDILARIRNGERVAHFETLRVRKDGSQVDVSLTISPVLAPDGSVMGASKIARDITEQKRVARELAAQREWFRVTLASIGDAVIATDVRGRVVFMNSMAERLTGYRIDDARGRTCHEVFHIVQEDTRHPAENPVERVLAHGMIVGLANHTVLVAADGTERPIDDSGAPIRSSTGELIGAVLVFRDISDRRRAEADRRSGAAERERLLEAERAARADAERASRVKDDFIAMVSHELRTPLNAILGWTQLMMRPGTDAEVMRRGLDVIARNARVQAQLISDLLDMSRIVSGKLHLSIERVDLESLIQNAIEAVQQAAESKRITVRREVHAVAPIAGDPARLQQIVWNLLWNAIKFTPEGGRVLVRLRTAGPHAEITVADTGVGIRPDVLPHIFERFQQGDPAVTRRFGGLGLGLAIARHLVDLHGGSIRAESAGEGKGATFTVLLPSSALVAEPGGQAAGAGGDPRAAAKVAEPLEALRILVVEDELDTLEFLRRFLESHGAEVLAARSAEEALALLVGGRVDVLISDIGLPDTDGYELLQRVRLLERNASAGMPAIALTAYARSEDRMAAFRAGYQAHLAKPVDPNELNAAITRLARRAPETSR